MMRFMMARVPERARARRCRLCNSVCCLDMRCQGFSFYFEQAAMHVQNSRVGRGGNRMDAMNENLIIMFLVQASCASQ